MSQISKKAVAALVFISMAATFVTPMARAQTYYYPAPQPSPIYYQASPQVIYQNDPQVIYQQPVYPQPVVVQAPYYNPVWPAVALGLGLGAVVGGWGHGGYGGYGGYGGGHGSERGGERGGGHVGGHGGEHGGHH
jgi:uncharacterized membrane protein YgcG